MGQKRLAAALLLVALRLGEASRDDRGNDHILEAGNDEPSRQAVHQAPSREEADNAIQHMLKLAEQGSNAQASELQQKQTMTNKAGTEHSAEEAKAAGAKAAVAEAQQAEKEAVAVSQKANMVKAKQQKKVDPDEVEEDSEGHGADTEELSVLCRVGDGEKPLVALRDIEACVKQLEMIKEGTLEQGRTSWEQNNEYVKALANLESRMTELARPEPFEIAFATDQEEMYNKLKDRLNKITSDLPKLEGEPPVGGSPVHEEAHAGDQEEEEEEE